MDKAELEKLADGLLYMSESDAPLNYFELDTEAAQQWPPATAAHFLTLIGEDPKTPVQEITPEQFFSALLQGNEDNKDQAKILQKTVTTELGNLKCYRVGIVEIKIYLLGKDASGKVCGLQTLSVET